MSIWRQTGVRKRLQFPGGCILALRCVHSNDSKHSSEEAQTTTDNHTRLYSGDFSELAAALRSCKDKSTTVSNSIKSAEEKHSFSELSRLALEKYEQKPTSERHFFTFKDRERYNKRTEERSSRLTRVLRSLLSYDRRVEGFLDPSDNTVLEDLTLTSAHRPIAQLKHGLDRVLFNPGVHWLQDPRSRVYNFPPYLENVPKVTDFAFERISRFIRSSRDEDLWELAKREKRTFAGSTSSLTGMLSQIYFLISSDKFVNTSILSRDFAHQPINFTPGQRMPSSVVFNYSDDVYAIDSGGDGNEVADKNILTWMGTLLEKYLTMTPEEFTTYMRSEPLPKEDEPRKEVYRYAKSQRFVMRSQLDCKDDRLPGTGIFDIKTRACLPIRLDMFNFEENSGYLIRTQHGSIESFEREYYDLIRSAFLKYSFQVRIGNMDGVIVAYHNTARIFGFQYISLEEMEQRLFGSNPGIGDRIFSKCVGLLECVADEIVRCFPKQSVKCTFDTEEGTNVMNVWVEPVDWESAGSRPIKQLEVKVVNFIDEDPVKGFIAMTATEGTWTTHWSISRRSNKESSIRKDLKEAKTRQFRAYSIPTGVDPADVSSFWDGLNFGGKPTSDTGSHPTPVFKPAGKSIKMLRSVARAGREETERLALEEAGLPKYVLGQPNPTSVDPHANAESMSLAYDIDGDSLEDAEDASDIEPTLKSHEPVSTKP